MKRTMLLKEQLSVIIPEKWEPGHTTQGHTGKPQGSTRRQKRARGRHWPQPFCFFSAAYGSSRARGPIRAAPARLCCSHSNTRSEPHLQAMLPAAPDPYPTEWGQGLNPHPHRDYVRLLTFWATVGTPDHSLYWGFHRRGKAGLALASLNVFSGFRRLSCLVSGPWGIIPFGAWESDKGCDWRYRPRLLHLL